ncbi:MAG: hypothetical protein ABR555_07040 [Pyrinomonadaceae bacterium]
MAAHPGIKSHSPSTARLFQHQQGEIWIAMASDEGAPLLDQTPQKSDTPERWDTLDLSRGDAPLSLAVYHISPR